MPQDTLEAGAELPGLTRACDVLAAGQAVVIPNPPPMTYGLVATAARVINVVKSRPLDQPVAASLHDPSEWQRLVPCLDLPTSVLDAVVALLDRHLSLLLPLRPEAAPPSWVGPAVRAEQVCVFNGRWAPTAVIWERFPRLFGSSANRTGQSPATSAAQARAIFGPDCAVVDGDALGGSRRLAASSMVALDRHGRLSLQRSGAHDQSHGRASAPQPEAYLAWLADLVGLPRGHTTGGQR